MRLLVKVPLEQDRWVVASQTRPGNAAVVHHMALTEVVLPAGMKPSDADSAEALAQQLGIPREQLGPTPAVSTGAKPQQIDMLGIYTPGSALETYREGTAKLLKGGNNMYLDFNIHYEAIGQAETDRSAIAFWFEPKPPEHQLFRVNGASEVILANGKELFLDGPGIKAEGTHVAIPPIPPFAENYELVGMTAYPQAVTIYQLQPHAHHRGRDFTYSVVYPDGREETLLTVPKFDERWQMAYEPETPVKLSAGSKLVVKAHYDNSSGNSHNHASQKPVYFRDMNQSWDEMFTPFIQYSIDMEKPSSGSLHRDPTENSAMEIIEVVGCLEATPKGGWQLSNAGERTPSEMQATTSTALKEAESKPLGNQVYRLLGASEFHPTSHRREKVVVKGLLITKTMSINVTSLQALPTSCPE